MKTSELRKKYIDFFKKNNHKYFPSDTLVPDDPTVLFTSAGMNQFKPYFLGEKKDVKSATSYQKCLRTGDLDEVGKTPFHHTFFEMLGNFSFGDYFKKEAISFAWEFLTTELNISADKLWVSVYKDDDEAYNVWVKEIKINESRIVRLGEKHNFWPASAPTLGPNGPCGPCSEIFFDRGKNKCDKTNCSPACDCERFVEVWNLVFTQFNRVDKDTLEPLPQKNIDTGMGLERMASVLQGKYSNYEIDILAPIVDKVRQALSIKSSDSQTISRINAIVDHSRAASFAIADGVYPSNEERGYVVRKIIRRALGSVNRLGYLKPFIYSLVDSFVEHMGDVYPEIKEKRDIIVKVIKAEEEQFLLIYNEGQKYLKNQIDLLIKNNKTTIAADELFKLHDTYGFPLDLSKDIADKYRMAVDEEGFNELLAKQRSRSRNHSMFDENIFKQGSLTLTEQTEFTGYDRCEDEVSIIKLFSKGEEIDTLDIGKEALLVFDRTPFYAEGGGQLTDKGSVETETGLFRVDSVFKVAEAFVHKGVVTQGTLFKAKAKAFVDVKRRKSLARAHTATHLLQAALRSVLGDHVSQQGSLVDVDRLRFDFTHFQGVTEKELKLIEDKVNGFILDSISVSKKNLSLEEAKAEGALAFFKEKYTDSVRMVSIEGCSKELCGGTHLDSTSEIGLFTIVSESSISSGVRRIEAIVGCLAYSAVRALKDKINGLANKLKSSSLDIETAILRLVDDYKKEKESNDSLNRKLLSFSIDDIFRNKKKVGENFVVIYKIDGKDYPDLLYLSDRLRRKDSKLIVFLYSFVDSKQIFVVSAADEALKSGFSCKKFISEYKDRLNLKGGGRDNLVQGMFLGSSLDLQEKLFNVMKDFIKQ